jgi:hypothetical protein
MKMFLLEKFYSLNAALNGEVILATFMRVFAEKVRKLLNPFECLVN